MTLSQAIQESNQTNILLGINANKEEVRACILENGLNDTVVVYTESEFNFFKPEALVEDVKKAWHLAA